MKKILQLFSSLTALPLLSNFNVINKFCNSEENKIIITEDDIDETEIKNLTINYFKSIEKINVINNIDKNKLENQINQTLIGLILAHIIEEKENFITLSSTMSNINSLDLATYSHLFLNYLLNLDNEKLVIMSIVDNFIERKFFKITVETSENENDKKFKFTIRKNNPQNFDHYFASLKRNTSVMHDDFENEANQIIIYDPNNFSIDPNLVNLDNLKAKIKAVLTLFQTENYLTIEKVRNIYDDIQITEKTFTIDFN